MAELLLLVLLALVAGRRLSPSATPPWPGSAPAPAPSPSPSPSPSPAPSSPEAWVPTSAPPGLPPWPSGWEPYVPTPPAAVTRASELIRALWSRGPGTRTTEQTGGEWVSYVATPMGERRGVVVYRPRQAAAASPVAARPAAASPVGLPVLRQGSRGPDVVALQQQLGVAADGIYGPQTAAVVRAYQQSHGLAPDGVVGPLTWASLGRTVRV